MIKINVKKLLSLAAMLIVSGCAPTSYSGNLDKQIDALVGKNIQEVITLLGKQDERQISADQMDYAWVNQVKSGSKTQSTNEEFKKSDCLTIVVTADLTGTVKHWAYMGNFGSCNPIQTPMINYRPL